MSKPIEASIVVVDDEPSIRDLLVASLHFAGFEENTAASGSEAIEAIEKSASTGKIGDGKIFVFDLEQAIRIRTGETGTDAL